MTFAIDIISTFLEKLRLCNSYPLVQSVILGGSVSQNTYTSSNDIDLLLVCDNKSSEKVYIELLKTFANNELQKTLDIKIIEVSHFNHINNSTDALYFHTFSKNSETIHGIDLRNKFLFSDMIGYRIIQESLGALDKIREVHYIYNQHDLSQILLFQVAKKLTLIWELYSKDKSKKTMNSTNYLQNIFGNSFKNIKEKMRKQRSWISIYSYKKKSSKFGFEEIPIMKRKKSGNSQSSREWFDGLLEKVRLLANDCLDLIGI